MILKTCKDCICEPVCPKCFAYKDVLNVSDYCEHFKDKADVVEVVRCKECEFYQRCESSLLGEVYVCTNQGDMRVQKEPADFCSWGHRKEGAEE